MREKDTLPVFTTSKAIRNGCVLDFYSVSKGRTIKGTVIKNSYGEKTHQHTFTIQESDGTKTQVKGRNLYPNIIKHIQGEDSINVSR